MSKIVKSPSMLTIIAIVITITAISFDLFIIPIVLFFVISIYFLCYHKKNLRKFKDNDTGKKFM